MYQIYIVNIGYCNMGAFLGNYKESFNVNIRNPLIIVILRYMNCCLIGKLFIIVTLKINKF